MPELIFLDTETTGNDILKDRLCQVCYKTSDGIYSGYFKPPIPVSIKAMSITNITNKMLEDNLSYLRYYLDLEVKNAYAHEAEGDVKVLYALFERLLAKMTEEGLTAAPHGGASLAQDEREENAIAEMLDISSRPTLFKLFTF